ncbi:MAG: murein biosynthesis integral membrane protein MurJ [Chloroflexi bacterium]|uniref:murein biosynthesis integral membrane protein MurJ n=1 Tax=Candidatus Flexifilum breve TaxID=3140694 RepID=UPI003136DDC5|nr:murein biosynthesis integral membrane protein MurJ [Chloroflexota bacterium]
MAKALSNTQIVRAAVVVVGGFLASGVLGLVRTAAFSATFGASEALDAFYAAQNIPEILFVLVAGGALGSSFIPVFARYLTAGDQAGAWRLASAVMSCVAVLAAALALIIGVFAPTLIPVLVPDAPPTMQALTIDLTRVMLVTVVIFSISGLLMGILNAQQIFTLPALALAANNIGQIVGALIIVPLLPDNSKIYGLAFGAVLGAVLHLVVQIPGLRHIDARLAFLPNPRVPGVIEVITLMGPRVLGLAVVQINFLVNLSLASGMVAGSYSALKTAWTLMFFVLGVIAQSVGTAVFPSLSALAAKNDLDGFKDRLAGALRGVLFLAFPATVGLILLGHVGISLLLQYGAWTPESTAATAWALGFFALGIAGHSLLEVLSRAFYALADTRTPVLVGIASMAANIALSLVLVHVVGDPNTLSRGSFAGLALANSLATLLEGAFLWWILRRRIGSLKDGYVLNGAARALAAALGMGAVVALIVNVLTNVGGLLTAVLGAGVGVGVFFALAFVFGVEEARTIPNMVLARFRR